MREQPYLLPSVVFLAIIALAFIPANGIRQDVPLLPQTGGVVTNAPQILGLVRFADGSPYKGPVLISRSGGNSQVETNESGNFSFAGAPGTYEILIPVGSRNSAEVRLDTTLVALQDTHITITLNQISPQP